MGWRSVIVSKPARLSLKNRQLLLEQDGGLSAALPVEDISVVVLETPQALISSALLAELAAHDVALITCDASHHPNGVLLPYLPHSRALKIMQKQLALTSPQKKRAWQQIVQAKLNNQAICLNTHHPDSGRFLFALSQRVNSGDTQNREGVGARYYFMELFGKKFTREQENWQNGALNYGYAILRAAIARSLVCHGFLPAFGLHHKNQLNQFNLADDLIEPLRPLVDYWVIANNSMLERDKLSTVDKSALVQLLYIDVVQQDEIMNTLSAIESMVNALARYCDSGELNELAWPKFLQK